MCMYAQAQQHPNLVVCDHTHVVYIHTHRTEGESSAHLYARPCNDVHLIIFIFIRWKKCFRTIKNNQRCTEHKQFNPTFSVVYLKYSKTWTCQNCTFTVMLVLSVLSMLVFQLVRTLCMLIYFLYENLQLFLTQVHSILKIHLSQSIFLVCSCFPLCSTCEGNNCILIQVLIYVPLCLKQKATTWVWPLWWRLSRKTFPWKFAMQSQKWLMEA